MDDLQMMQVARQVEQLVALYNEFIEKIEPSASGGPQIVQVEEIMHLRRTVITALEETRELTALPPLSADEASTLSSLTMCLRALEASVESCMSTLNSPKHALRTSISKSIPFLYSKDRIRKWSFVYEWMISGTLKSIASLIQNNQRIKEAHESFLKEFNGITNVAQLSQLTRGGAYDMASLVLNDDTNSFRGNSDPRFDPRRDAEIRFTELLNSSQPTIYLKCVPYDPFFAARPSIESLRSVNMSLPLTSVYATVEDKGNRTQTEGHGIRATGGPEIEEHPDTEAKDIQLCYLQSRINAQP